MAEQSPVVAVVMGSSSDAGVMQGALDVLADFSIPFEAHVLSAHRQARAMLTFGEEAAELGFKVIIAGAGGAAHLPGMVAALTTLPVIGVPVAQPRLDGMDSLLSIVQMPRGVPVATVAINNATNAGLLALRMLALADEKLSIALGDYREEIAEQAHEQDRQLKR